MDWKKERNMKFIFANEATGKFCGLRIVYKCAMVFTYSHVSMLCLSWPLGAPPSAAGAEMSFSSDCVPEGKIPGHHLQVLLLHSLLFSHHNFASPNCLCLLQEVFFDIIVPKFPPWAEGSSLALNFHSSWSEPTVAITFFLLLVTCLSPPTNGRLWLWLTLLLSHSTLGQGPTWGQA